MTATNARSTAKGISLRSQPFFRASGRGVISIHLCSGAASIIIVALTLSPERKRWRSFSMSSAVA